MDNRARLGITSYAYDYAISEPGSGRKPLTAFQLIEKAAQHQLKVVQICENLPLNNLDADELCRLKRLSQSLGISLELGARGLDPKHLESVFDLACRLNVRLLRLVPWSGSEIRRPISGDQVFQALEPILPICRKEGVTLAIENYFDLPDEELASMLKQAADPYLGVCLDTANSTGSLAKPLETARILAPFIVSVHLKDYVVLKPRQGYRISGAPLGKGCLDLHAILEIINLRSRNAHLLIEHWIDCEGPIESILEKEENWVSQSIQFVRQELRPS
jgi:sugar phosphate isomerase/epimerase